MGNELGYDFKSWFNMSFFAKYKHSNSMYLIYIGVGCFLFSENM